MLVLCQYIGYRTVLRNFAGGTFFYVRKKEEIQKAIQVSELQLHTHVRLVRFPARYPVLECSMVLAQGGWASRVYQPFCSFNRQEGFFLFLILYFCR